MAIQRIVDYIHECKKTRLAPSKIRESLLQAGWAAYEVEEAIREVLVEKPKSAPPRQRKAFHTPDFIKMKIRKTGWIAAAILIVAFGLAVVIGENKTPELETPRGIKACESNFDCLIQAAGRCEQASGIAALKLEAMGLSLDETIEIGILGAEGEQCRVEFSPLNSSLSEESKQELAASGLSEPQISAAETEAKTMVAPSPSCLFSRDHLKELFGNWKQNRASINDWGAGNCGVKAEGECALATPSPYVDLAFKGKALVTVSGFSGSGDAVSWLSRDPSIASVEQGRGASTQIKAKAYGSTKLVATDSTNGCSLEILVEVI
jgi:hypothetical protein